MSLTASTPAPFVPKPKAEFLTAHLYVSGVALRLLRAGADLHGYPSADHLANHLLLEAFERMPEVTALEAEIARISQRAREAHLEARNQRHLAAPAIEQTEPTQ